MTSQPDKSDASLLAPVQQPSLHISPSADFLVDKLSFPSIFCLLSWNIYALRLKLSDNLTKRQPLNNLSFTRLLIAVVYLFMIHDFEPVWSSAESSKLLILLS